MSAATPGQADMAALVRAAQAADHATRPVSRSWTRVGDDQVARLIGGAQAALIAAQEPHAAPGDLLGKRIFHLASELENEADQLRAEGGSGWISRLEVAARVRAALDEHPEPKPAPELAALREGITALARDLDASAKATSPSKKSNIEAECAIALRKLLEGK